MRFRIYMGKSVQ